MAEKFIVLGSNSFSGSHFIDHLLSQEITVWGISRSPEPHATFLPYKGNQNLSYFRFLQLDLNHDLNHIMAVLDEIEPDYVVNFAAQGMVAESWKHPEHWFTTNLVSTVKLHDQLRIRPYLKRYVHVSTPEVYGTCEGNIKENTRYQPSTPYAVSRAACDLSLMTFFRNYNFPAVFTRSANVFGPSQQLYRIIPRTLLFLKLGRKLQLHGGGHSVRSFIHIRDVAEGTLRAARQAAPGNIFHFSTLRQISIRSLVEIMCKRAGVAFDDAVEIVEDRPGKDAAYLLDTMKARQELGWRDCISLEDGIDETAKWIESDFEILRHQHIDYIHKP